MSKDLEIDSFQFENLMLNQIPFTLIDLRRQRQKASPLVARYLAQAAVPLEAGAVEAYLQSHKIAKEAPIVLFCEKGYRSGPLATRLSKMGYSNIYFTKYS